jgi:integrase
MEHLPFCVFKRAGREFYYVKFKNEAGTYSPAVSTKQKTKAAAIATAFDWLRNGKPSGRASEQETCETIPLSLMDALRRIKTTGEAGFICEELKRKGLLREFVIQKSRQDVDFPSFLQNFWDFETSPYIKEKLRKNHGIHRYYVMRQKQAVKKYWSPFFEGRLLGSISRQDIENFIDAIADNRYSKRELSAARKNKIVKAGVIPLRWAFAKDIIGKDASSGITWFSGVCKERQILTPEIAEVLFRVEWKDERARLANLLAAVTGLRAGEIMGLQTQDLKDGYINVRHSWNIVDGLKTTKNNEVRVVEIPFPNLIYALTVLAERNPHGSGTDSYVFWADRLSGRPVQEVLFIRGLRDALVKTGMSREAAEGYVFHGWRHFYTSYMRGRLDMKLLQSQTGHKSIFMVDHYSDHLLSGDRERIRQAVLEAFGSLIPADPMKASCEFANPNSENPA